MKLATGISKFAGLGISLLVLLAAPSISDAKSSQKGSKSSTKNSSKTESKKAAKESMPKEAVSNESSNLESEIKAQLALISKALATSDETALSGLWTEDGVYTDVSGTSYKGKDSIHKRFDALMKAEGQQYVEFMPDSIRTIAPGVVSTEGTVCRKDGIEGPTPETRYSIVFVKKNDGWHIATAMETQMNAGTSKEPLSELNFLIGQWSAEKDGSSVNMTADWVADKHFITCKFEFKKGPNDKVLESRQVIGWDPRDQQPISWHFDSNGGFGYGTWLRKDNQWIVKATGVDPDGATTTAVNIISLSDKNSFSWQSVNRNINGIAFNDTQPLKVERVSR